MHFELRSIWTKMASLYKIALYCILVISIDVIKAEKRTAKDYIYAQKFLKQYHYLSPLKNGNHNWKYALEVYQEFMHLPVTGKLDDGTFQEMHKPRCGLPDVEDDDGSDQQGSKLRKRFAVSAQPWPTKHLTYTFMNYGSDMSQFEYERILAQAFKIWSDSSLLTFTPTNDKSGANIKIAFGRRSHANCSIPFDGPGTVLAHAKFPVDGALHFDEDETFTDGTSSGTNLLSVAVHEIGHVIGISHQVYDTAAIMHPAYKAYNPNLKLHHDDINAARYLYGGGTVAPQATQPSKCADVLSDCDSYKSLCQGANADAMKKNCASTCGYCVQGQSNTAGCKNLLPLDWCNLYKQHKLCNLDRISKNCLLTCKPSCQQLGK